MLLDRWNQKHIELLKNKFTSTITNQNKRGLDKEAFEKLFHELRDVPKGVVAAAFKFFDQDNTGIIDFREFCCALSLICLSGTEEKIKFIFELFDQDRDDFLNSSEILTLLKTSIASFRKFSRGPGDLFDDQWIEAQRSELLGGQDRVDFERF